MIRTASAQLLDVLKYASLVFGNEVEFEALAKLLGAPGAVLAASTLGTWDGGCRTVVATFGADRGRKRVQNG